MSSALPELEQLADTFCADANELDVSSPHLVHGDCFPGNVIVDAAVTVTGIVDFSSMTVAGDPALDVAGALAFLTITPGIRAGDVRHVHERASRLAPGAMRRHEIYQRFYALRYLHARNDDLALYRWCLAMLRGSPTGAT